MKKISLILLSIGVLGCSTSRLADSPGLKRMTTVKSDGYSPSFFYTQFRPSLGSSRAPASVATPSELSNKETYFLGMWEQKIKMEKILGKSSRSICPAFHNLLISAQNDISEKDFDSSSALKKDWQEALRSGDIISNPVLTLPVDGGSDVYTMYRNGESVEQDSITRAFEGFYKNTQREVQELCDTGTSPGYYVFENMVNFYSKDKSFMSGPKVVSSLLKVEPVANFYVLKTILKSAPGKYESMALHKLNAKWFDGYIEKASRNTGRSVSSTRGPL